MAFSLPELPYATTALEPYLSAETFEYHYGKHHKAYVDTLNAMVEGTDERRLPRGHHPEGRGQAVQPGRPGLEPQPVLGLDGARRRWCAERAPPATRSTRPSARFDTFQEQFKTSATGQFGSGWTWLTLDGGKLAISPPSNADLPMKHGRRRSSRATCGSTPTTSTTATPARLRRHLPRPPDQLAAARGRPLELVDVDREPLGRFRSYARLAPPTPSGRRRSRRRALGVSLRRHRSSRAAGRAGTR